MGRGHRIQIQVAITPKHMFFHLILFSSNINRTYVTKSLNLSVYRIFPNSTLGQNFTDLYVEIGNSKKKGKETREQEGRKDNIKSVDGEVATLKTEMGHIHTCVS